MPSTLYGGYPPTFDAIQLLRDMQRDIKHGQISCADNIK